MLVVHLVDVLAPVGSLVLDCDDTLYKKSGRKVDGAGSFRGVCDNFVMVYPSEYSACWNIRTRWR